MNLDEREQEFKDWLLDYLDLDTKTAHDYIGRLRNLERRRNVKLDKEYKRDKLEELLEMCKYNQADEDNGKEDKIGLDMYETSMVKHHQSWLDALAQYRVFCDKHPNFIVKE